MLLAAGFVGAENFRLKLGEPGRFTTKSLALDDIYTI
jgi:hypothetical protein